MSEDVYAKPDLTKKVRHVQAEREVEMETRGENEDRGEREERMVDIYVSVDDLDLDHVPVPGTQPDADSPEPKKNGFSAAAVCLGLLSLLLLAGIIGLVIKYSDSIQKNNNLTKSLDEMQTSFKQLESSYDNQTNDLREMQYTNKNLAEQKAKLLTSFKQLQSRCDNLTSSDGIKRFLCESSGFTFAGGVCYYISTEEKTWNESREWCRANQSDLMVIKSPEKQKLVVGLISNQTVWLGLTDRDTEGQWKWVDGTLLNTTYWRAGQPDNSGGKEDCVDVRKDGWHDFPCSQQNLWICERAVC